MPTQKPVEAHSHWEGEGSWVLSTFILYIWTSLFFNQVLEGYGQTETTAAATVQMIGDQTYGEK